MSKRTQSQNGENEQYKSNELSVSIVRLVASRAVDEGGSKKPNEASVGMQ
jgi:hypothetical protein